MLAEEREMLFLTSYEEKGVVHAQGFSFKLGFLLVASFMNIENDDLCHLLLSYIPDEATHSYHGQPLQPTQDNNTIFLQASGGRPRLAYTYRRPALNNL